ncbi:hypothetical protein HHI36_006014 [Cryptolaemus montrouzieri]|uniref:Uncharacterized protein n=1 Tax=Cryptolaemus montrouzieri TaxID=559131 RepID=A0ABD2NVS4_9CUCU
MSFYFNWMKSKKEVEIPCYIKPRSVSLDPKSLEDSGIQTIRYRYNQIKAHQLPGGKYWKLLLDSLSMGLVRHLITRWSTNTI